MNKGATETKQYTAIGQQWTAIDDVPRYSDSFYITVEAASLEEAKRRVEQRMLPPVGFLHELTIFPSLQG